ncbi:hypothetical protein ACN6KF_003493 [Labrys sp. La1]|uniref:hypothetical protein n=1 Tax=Labrys sp. La1 TaxID=3404917 RepID=UPI003EBD0FEE
MKLLSRAGLTICLTMLPVSVALGAPTYLSCSFPNPPKEPQIFNFALDASSGTLGVHVPETGSERKVRAVFGASTVTANEGSVAWEIDLSRRAVIRDKRMVGEKDRGACKDISAEESGFGQ